MSTQFWNLYSKTYDLATLNFSAYKELIDIASSSLDLKEGDIIFNAGCGTGNLENKLKETDTKFTWVGGDISFEMLNRAKSKIADNRFRFLEIDLDKELEIQNDSVDKIISIHSLYTVNDPGFTLKELARILKEKGRLLIINPKKGAKMGEMFNYELNRRNIISFVFLLLRVLPALIINLIIAKRAKNSDYHFLNEEDLDSLLIKNGFKILEKKFVYADQSIFVIAEKQYGQ